MPVTPQLITDNAYQTLVDVIQTEVTEGLDRMEHFARSQRVQTYWQIGQTITKFLHNKNHAQIYGRRLFQQLGDDLSMDYRTLYQCTAFYRAYPQIDPQVPLSWSHYRYLSQLDSAKERRHWEKKIIKENISVKDFLAMVNDQRPDDASPQLAPCSFIVVCTYQSDKYDRYLSDVFYAPDVKDPQVVADRGRYLNQELLNHRHAVLWQ